MRTLLIATLLLLPGLPVLAQPENPHAEAAPSVDAMAAQKDPEVLSVASGMVCNCGVCPHVQLDKCTCGTAQQLRYEIAQLLAAGMDETKAFEAMLDRHGMGLLAEPPNTVGGIFAKRVLPVGLFLLGVGIVSMVIMRWRRRDIELSEQPKEDASGPAVDEDDYLARVEEELEKRS